MAVCVFEQMSFRPALICKGGGCGAKTSQAVEACCGNMCDSVEPQILVEAHLIAARSIDLPVGAITTLLGRIALVEEQTGFDLM